MFNQLEKLIQEFGLSRVAEDIKRALRNSIRMYTEKVDEDTIPLGTTKIGGKPDVPKGFEWPKYYDNPLSFIAQINMAEIVPFDTERILPASGMLYFFYDCEQQTWGFDPEDKDCWKVHYYDGSLDELIRMEFHEELPEYAQYHAVKVSFKNEISLPSWDSDYIDSLNLSEEEKDAFSELCEKFIGEQQVINKLLGHSDNIQGDMQLECQLVSNGLYCGDSSGYESPDRAKLEKDAKDWRLLLQIDSDENAQMMWGDVGRLYFWIKENDLRLKNFDKVWMILQCY